MPLDLAILLGGMDGGPLESWVRAALEASALDSAEAARASGAYGRIFLLTDRAPQLPVPEGVLVETDTEAGATPFHYGARLTGWVARHGVDQFATAGAGSAPLLQPADWQALSAALTTDGVPGRACCVANNRFSADVYALTPAAALTLLDPAPATDNAVPRRLRDQHGVDLVELPRTVATQFNLDTPSDLAALALVGQGGPRLRRLLRDGEMRLDTTSLERAAACLTERAAEVLVAGRVSSATWNYLERESACRVRVLAEERGMQAAGTDADGTARSILGALIAESGPERVFGTLLPEWCDAAFIDIRPALVHLGIRPSRADRFAADAGRAEAITDPRLRALVAAALAAPVPVVLGGHSLVGGVLPLVNQHAWDARDAREGRPQP